ncbi:hypothetical protein FB451DRAFT_1363853 [Mycena latifolia]|nr:hypothetical protein FB451DRAFT_1363853 [Mycena latifolia]
MIFSLLRSGRIPPSSQQRENIQSVIHSVEAEISRDQDRIRDLQAQMALLKGRVAVREENQRVLTSLFSPIRKLPPEIIQLVLEFSVGANHFRDEQSVSGATRVSFVCAQWRTIAHATPQIWAAFMVHFLDDAPPRGVLKSIERHLRLAGNAKLDLDFFAPTTVSKVSHEILELFTPHAARWRSAIFQLGSITPRATEILATTLDNTPALKSLHIRRHYNNTGSDIDIELFKSCPGLQSLSLIKHRATSGIPWAQLTSVYFSPTFVEETFRVLGLCPNLVSLALSVPMTFTMEQGQLGRTPQTYQLHTLRINSRHSSHCRVLSGVLALCNAMTLPQLTSLTLSSNLRRRSRLDDEPRYEAGAWPQAAVVALLARSACTLKIVRLEGIPLDTPEALELLRLAPAATDVSLRECKKPHTARLSDYHLRKVQPDLTANHFVTTAFLAALVEPAPDTPLLPRLRHLELSVNVGLNIDVYVAAVRARWLVPNVPSGVDSLDAISLTAMVDDGDPDLRPVERGAGAGAEAGGAGRAIRRWRHEY